MIFLLLACSDSTQLPTQKLMVGREVVVAEVADDGEERAMGLMFRDELTENAGMLFVYPDYRERSFWMKNTRILLSIAFLDREGVIRSLAEMRPLDETMTPSGAEAKYALEMPGGWFTAHGVVVGDTVTGLPAAAE